MINPASPLLVALLAGLFGAIMGGIVQAALRVSERKKEREAVRAALVMEVAEICQLMRFRRYEEVAAELVKELKLNLDARGTLIADLREDYFAVFHALAPDLGKLEANEARQIVRFYMLCKSAKDSIPPDGIMVENEDHDLAVENAQQLHTLMRLALAEGNEIAKWMPQSEKVQHDGKSLV